MLHPSSRYMFLAVHRNAPSLSKRAVSTMPATASPSLKLARLPVPTLRKSLDGYLKSIQPVLLQDEAQSGVSFDAAYEKRVKLANEFESGIGSVLQERLLALDRNSPTNWLDDNFWMQKVYHEPRDPILINSNWWLVFKDDPTIPEVARTSLPGTPCGISPWQVRRAASMVYRTLEFRDKLADQTLYPETTRTGIWLNSATRKMFSVCRVPGHQSDSLSQLPDPHSPYARQVVVLIHDHFYTIEVYDETWTRKTPDRIEKLLFACVRDVEQRLDQATPIGVLTADDRSVWAQNYSRLQSMSPTNRKTFQKIHESLFCLSLDHFISPTAPLVPDEQHTGSNLRDHLHLVRSSYHARNRFFDKPYTLIVDPLARAGAMGEHSPVDALVPSIVGEYAIVEGICEGAFDTSPEEVAAVCEMPQDGWRRLEWVVDEAIKKECLLAEERAVAIIEDSDDEVFCFDKYGGDWIKDTTQLSPDAYIQMALQLAWYETRGSFTPTYETALTRLFQNGRTETIRTLTMDSCNWVRSMVNNKATSVERFTLLKRAVLTHTRLTREAAMGKGIDRHLLGLRLMMQRDCGEDAELFTDELFQRSQTWKLSTSGLSAGHHFKGTGFGTPWTDGYGINYLAGPDMIKFGIESKRSCEETSTQRFGEAVGRALESMRVICLEGMDAKL